jgi:hypothetical protein
MEMWQPQLPGPMKRQLDIEVVYIHGIGIVPLVTVRQSQKYICKDVIDA